MLINLQIKNFALIDNLQLQLDDGFTTITGETGAGKSILLGALSLLLGKRADLSSVKNPEQKCVVEGIFAIADYGFEGFFVEQDLDYEERSIVRREILPSGKSRAFINDTPVKLSVLENFGNRLIDIHSQHETLSVGNPDYQFKIIDALAGNHSLLKNYRENHALFLKLKGDLEKLKAEQKEADAAYDYNQFLLKELQDADLKSGMQEELEEQYERLANVETIKEKLGEASERLRQEELGGLEILRETHNRLSDIEGFSAAYKSLKERLNSARLELEDVANEMENELEKLEDDPETLQFTNDRLQVLYTLQKKHEVSSVEELILIRENLSEKVAVTESAEESLAKLEKELSVVESTTKEAAIQLHESRKSAIPGFVSSVEKILSELGMSDSRLTIELKQEKHFYSRGMDEMNWLFSANKGSEFKVLKKTASGGELSRITLAIKSILAQYSKLPTIIFDEIDTGVSGEIAQKMGDIMASMGENMQVISITHLPQIAAKGKQHFKVYKETEEKVTRTKIIKLNQGERIAELSAMLGGKENRESAEAHAKALLG